MGSMNMKLQKIPIDYSKAGTGEAPFDGKPYLLINDEEGHDCVSIGAWDIRRFKFYRPNIYACDNKIWTETVYRWKPTHYTPMPQFEEVKGGA